MVGPWAVVLTSRGRRIQLSVTALVFGWEVFTVQTLSRTRMASQDYTESSHHNIKVTSC